MAQRKSNKRKTSSSNNLVSSGLTFVGEPITPDRDG